MVYAHDCAVDRYTFDGSSTGTTLLLVKDARNQAECKVKCDSDVTCGQWSWSRAKGNAKPCTLSTGLAHPKYDKDSFTVPKAGNSSCTCPATALVVGLPPASAAASKILFGASSTEAIGQPFGLECWPKDENFKLYSCGATDLHRVHLSDTGNEFLANCGKTVGGVNAIMPKVERGGVVPVDSAWCEADCKSDVTCMVWQFVPKKVLPPGTISDRKKWGCYQSKAGPDNCHEARTYKLTVAPAAAALQPAPYSVAGGRVQHGLVRVVGKLDNNQVLGLHKVFISGTYSTEVVDKAMCKEICYSDIYCTVWQYFEKAGIKSTVPNRKAAGCFVEDATSKAVDYPLALNKASQFAAANQGSHTWITGEFIQHYCPDPSKTTTPPPVNAHGPHVAGAVTPPPSAHSSSLWSWLLPLLLLLALVASAAVALLFCRGDPKKKKKTRSARSRAIEEIEAPLQVVSTPVTATPTYYAAQPAQMVQLQPRPTQVMVQPQLVQASAPVPVQYAQPAVNPGIRF